MKISGKTMRWSYHRSDKTLVFGRFPGEAVADEANLGDHSLPGLLLSLSCFDDFEHFGFSLGTHFGQRHLPFTLQGRKIVVNWGSDNIITLKNHGMTITDLNCGVLKHLDTAPNTCAQSEHFIMYNFVVRLLHTINHQIIFRRKTWNIPVVKVKSRWRHLRPSPSSSVWSCWRGL